MMDSCSPRRRCRAAPPPLGPARRRGMLFSKKGNDMPHYRNALPQLDGSLFLTDAGLETDLIFNHGIEIRAFAAHTLLPDPQAMALVERYFEGFLALAADLNTGFILDTVTWRAHS